MNVSKRKRLDYVMQIYAGAISNPDLTSKLCHDVDKHGIDERLFTYVVELVNNRVNLLENLNQEVK